MNCRIKLFYDLFSNFKDFFAIKTWLDFDLCRRRTWGSGFWFQEIPKMHNLFQEFRRKYEMQNWIKIWSTKKKFCIFPFLLNRYTIWRQPPKHICQLRPFPVLKIQGKLYIRIQGLNNHNDLKRQFSFLTRVQTIKCSQQ